MDDDAAIGVDEDLVDLRQRQGAAGVGDAERAVLDVDHQAALGGGEPAREVQGHHAVGVLVGVVEARVDEHRHVTGEVVDLGDAPLLEGGEAPVARPGLLQRPGDAALAVVGVGLELGAEKARVRVVEPRAVEARDVLGGGRGAKAQALGRGEPGEALGQRRREGREGGGIDVEVADHALDPALRQDGAEEVPLVRGDEARDPGQARDVAAVGVAKLLFAFEDEESNARVARERRAREEGLQGRAEGGEVLVIGAHAERERVARGLHPGEVLKREHASALAADERHVGGHVGQPPVGDVDDVRSARQVELGDGADRRGAQGAVGVPLRADPDAVTVDLLGVAGELAPHDVVLGDLHRDRLAVVVPAAELLPLEDAADVGVRGPAGLGEEVHVGERRLGDGADQGRDRRNVVGDARQHDDVVRVGVGRGEGAVEDVWVARGDAGVVADDLAIDDEIVVAADAVGVGAAGGDDAAREGLLGRRAREPHELVRDLGRQPRREEGEEALDLARGGVVGVLQLEGPEGARVGAIGVGGVVEQRADAEEALVAGAGREAARGVELRRVQAVAVGDEAQIEGQRRLALKRAVDGGDGREAAARDGGDGPAGDGDAVEEAEPRPLVVEIVEARVEEVDPRRGLALEVVEDELQLERRAAVAAVVEQAGLGVEAEDGVVVELRRRLEETLAGRVAVGPRIARARVVRDGIARDRIARLDRVPDEGVDVSAVEGVAVGPATAGLTRGQGER